MESNPVLQTSIETCNQLDLQDVSIYFWSGNRLYADYHFIAKNETESQVKKKIQEIVTQIIK